MTPERVREIQRISLDPLSLDLVGDDDDRTADFIKDDGAEEPDDVATRQMLQNEVRKSGELNERRAAGRDHALRARRRAAAHPRRGGQGVRGHPRASARSSPRRSPSCAIPTARRSCASTSRAPDALGVSAVTPRRDDGGVGYRGKLAEQERRALRAQAWTLNEIAAELGVSKSSVSCGCAGPVR